MIVNFKFFYEKDLIDHEEYNKLWEENKERFAFLYTHLSPKEQREQLISEISEDKNEKNEKDILVLRFPSNKFIKNIIINDLMLGKGFKYNDNDKNNKIWHPKEVWIYNQSNL